MTAPAIPDLREAVARRLFEHDWPAEPSWVEWVAYTTERPKLRKEVEQYRARADGPLASVMRGRDNASDVYLMACKQWGKEIEAARHEITALKAAACRDGEAARQEIARLRDLDNAVEEAWAEYSPAPYAKSLALHDKWVTALRNFEAEAIAFARAALTTTETRDA